MYILKLRREEHHKDDDKKLVEVLEQRPLDAQNETAAKSEAIWIAVRCGGVLACELVSLDFDGKLSSIALDQKSIEKARRDYQKQQERAAAERAMRQDS